jgi:hypothetical protein
MPSETSSNQSQIIQLLWCDKAARVVVTPDDEDRFAITVGEAVEACRAYTKSEQFKRQFTLMLRTLAEWIRHNQEKIEASFVTRRDNGLLFLVVQKSPRHDPEFEAALTELDIQIANDPMMDLIELSVMSLPCASEDCIDSFIHPALKLKYTHAQ